MSFDSGSTKPIKSAYQADPWEPDSDDAKGAQKDAIDDYTSVYGAGTSDSSSSSDSSDSSSEANEISGKVPGLSMVYSDALDFIPVTSDDDDTSTKPDESLWAGEFYVELSTLHSAEQTCLDATSASIDGYNTLKAEVAKATGANFFGQQAGHEAVQNLDNDAHTGQTNFTTYWQPDDLDEGSQNFADMIIPKMNNLLNGIGGAIEVMGIFNALLNNAGQSYATVDNNSAFTDG